MKKIAKYQPTKQYVCPPEIEAIFTKSFASEEDARYYVHCVMSKYLLERLKKELIRKLDEVQKKAALQSLTIFE